MLVASHAVSQRTAASAQSTAAQTQSSSGQPASEPVLTQQQPAGQPTYQTVPPIAALPSKAQHEANFDAEMQQANALFVAGKQLDALPLYEDLCRQDPTVALFAERHAAALMVKQSTPGLDSKESLNAFIQEYNELHRAQALGDNSALVRTLLITAEKTFLGSVITGVPLTVGYTYRGTPAVQATMGQASSAFAAGKFDDAARLYIAAAGQDPALYIAALYAGDSFYRNKD